MRPQCFKASRADPISGRRGIVVDDRVDRLSPGLKGIEMSGQHANIHGAMVTVEKLIAWVRSDHAWPLFDVDAPRQQARHRKTEPQAVMR